ncbi:UDP-N-acetylmuramate--L-alanine ligase [Candidatus Poribacteria bacterium]|nr:UDP-N-acetylmuramate--L-alanine ligase [Candidatus Poribacteria bacterium]
MSNSKSLLDERLAARARAEGRIPPPTNPLGFRRVHLIGIGGCGMSGIARALLASGIEVSGSDLQFGDSSKRLRNAGARIFIGHGEENLGSPDLVVYSSAISPSNPELAAAHARGLRIVHRSEALAMFLGTRKSVLVTGTHGKTTTTAMTGLILEAAGFDPWAFVGGFVPAFEGNTRVGGLEWAVAEADESDGSFERLPCNHLIVTNVEDDHLDYWKSNEAMVNGYRRVVMNTSATGAILMSIDDPGACELRHSVGAPVLTYSVRAMAGDYSAGNIELDPYSSSFTFYAGRSPLMRLTVGVPGLQNVSNAVAAAGLALELGADPQAISRALEAYHGVGRRFQVKGEAAGVTVIDDYAHHPTEIIATIDAARAARARRGGRLVAIFQPHRYTRTQNLMNAFAVAFTGCDLLVLTDIYSAGEAPIEGVTGEALAARLAESGQRHLRYIARREAIAAELAGELREGDLVLTLGAGDITRTGGELLELLNARMPNAGAA